jgi:prevent-host-death family protein
MDTMTAEGQDVTMTEVVSVADAKRRFSELIERVGRGERFVVERRGKPVLALVPPTDVDPGREQPAKRGFLALWGILEGVEGADEWYDDMQQIVADRRNWPPKEMPYFDDVDE